MTARQPESNEPPAWHGLSEEAQSALIRRSIEPSTASQLLRSESEEPDLNPVIESWLRAELEEGVDGKGALERWRKYEEMLDVEVPADVDAFMEQGGMSLESKLGRLVRAKQALTATGEKTPSGKNIGETMHLVLLPWKAYQEKLRQGSEENDPWARRGSASFERWMDRLVRPRGDMDYGIEVDHASNRPNGSGIHTAFEKDYAIYRDPRDPAKRVTFSEYLTGRIYEDGPWGIMLAQTGKKGLYVPPDGPQQADTYTGKGKENFQIAGYNVDAMGILEWLSLVCQAKKGKINSASGQRPYSLLLANRSHYHVGGLEEVVRASYDTLSNREGDDTGKGFIFYTSPDGDGGFEDRDRYGTILAVQ